MAKRSPSYACTECGSQSRRWAGRCSACGTMNSLVEVSANEAELLSNSSTRQQAAAGLNIESLAMADGTEPPRLRTGIAELDRVLGGGLVPGSVVLLGGEPGIGKSTLLAQLGGALAGHGPVCYVSAEESTSQVRERCRRLGLADCGLELANSNDADAIVGLLLQDRYRLVVVDSIQLVALAGVDGAPGSVSQVRGSATALVEAVKRGSGALVIVGHVTKDGNLAGPRLLEHLVDTVLAFEGDRYHDLRTLRAVKNRFGSTNEIGLFTMAQQGLQEVADPGGLFIEGRPATTPGSCVVPILEGNRCLLVEVQALVNSTDFPQPQRRVAGCDGNRVAMILAVLSRRLRLPLGSHDVFVNVTGGARIGEPAADLGIALAVVSAFRDQPLPTDLVGLGEVGLGGELRPASRYDLRAAEARRLGFKRLLGPGPGQGRGRLKAQHLIEAIDMAGLA